jgi:hypothetical protein
MRGSLRVDDSTLRVCQLTREMLKRLPEPFTDSARSNERSGCKQRSRIGRATHAPVARGGHDIPEDLIRRRWDDSRTHLIEVMPYVSEVRVFDNSEEGVLTPA